MYKGGCRKDPIWDHFNLIEEGNKKSAQCKVCLNVTLMTKTRISMYTFIDFYFTVVYILMDVCK